LFSKSLFCAENLCVINGKMEVSPPIISQAQQLVHHNLLLAHLFVALTRAPAMQCCEINPAKHRTITALLDATFPPIASTDDVPTPYVTPRTIAYIHALIVDSITLHPSTTMRERALLNETMVLDVLNTMSPQASREELFTVLNQYHVQILKIASASGRPGAKTFRRSLGSAAALSAAEVAEASEAAAANPPAPQHAPAEPPAPPPAAPPAAAAPRQRPLLQMAGVEKPRKCDDWNECFD
jgi:pyruvate/2-oxoglutarate dehydrogenase complex dihydrolipoamide acyltransferase (E2) component